MYKGGAPVTYVFSVYLSLFYALYMVFPHLTMSTIIIIIANTDGALDGPTTSSDHFNMYSFIYPHKNSMR